MEWKLLEIEELIDGRVWLKWRTVADDGLPLVEGDYLIPETTDLQKEIINFCHQKKADRKRINAAPKVVPKKKPRTRRTTATLNQTEREALMKKLSEG